MVKMFLMICVVWVEGPRHSGGETNCLWHISKVDYYTEKSCIDEIELSKKLVIRRLEKEFGHKNPQGYNVQASCLKST